MLVDWRGQKQVSLRPWIQFVRKVSTNSRSDQNNPLYVDIPWVILVGFLGILISWRLSWSLCNWRGFHPIQQSTRVNWSLRRRHWRISCRFFTPEKWAGWSRWSFPEFWELPYLFVGRRFVKNFHGVTWFEHLKRDAVDVAFRHAKDASQAFLRTDGLDSCQDDHSTIFLTDRYCWWLKSCEPVEVGSLSHYLQGSIHPRLCRISAINSTSRNTQINKHGDET